MPTKNDRLDLGDEGKEIQPMKVPLAITVAEATALLSRLADDFTEAEAERVQSIETRLRATLGMPMRGAGK